MALNINNRETEKLATEVAPLARETKTEAIRLLESRIWPSIPADVLGKPVSKEEKEAILGYGPEGF